MNRWPLVAWVSIDGNKNLRPLAANSFHLCWGAVGGVKSTALELTTWA